MIENREKVSEKNKRDREGEENERKKFAKRKRERIFPEENVKIWFNYYITNRVDRPSESSERFLQLELLSIKTLRRI